METTNSSDDAGARVLVVIDHATRECAARPASAGEAASMAVAGVWVVCDRGDVPGPAAALQGWAAERVAIGRPAGGGAGRVQKIALTHARRGGFTHVLYWDLRSAYDAAAAREFLGSALGASGSAYACRHGSRRACRRGGVGPATWVRHVFMAGLLRRVLGVPMPDIYSGLRLYRMRDLDGVPFEFNGDDAHFDAEITLQLLSKGIHVASLAVPFRQGRARGIRRHVFGLYTLLAALRLRLFRMGLFYDPYLDFGLFEQDNYFFKQAPNSLHQYVVRMALAPGERVLDFGAGRGYISARLAERGAHVAAVDARAPASAGTAEAVGFDLNGDFVGVFGENRFDTVVALDVIEHLHAPELCVQRLARVLRPGGRLIASTGNIAFWPMRAALLLGTFNYGKRGILDRTHMRLFTLGSFRRLLERHGFKVERVRGFGPPVRDLVSGHFPFGWIDAALGGLARVSPRHFSYVFALEARRVARVDEQERELLG